MTWFRIRKGEREQVKSGFFLVGHLLGAMSTFGILIVGVGLLRSPKTFQTWSWLQANPYLYGCLFVIIASVVLWLTMQRWSRVLPWVFATGALRAFVSVATGYAYSPPSKPIPRTEAAAVGIVMLLIAMLSGVLASRRLRYGDYVAFLALYFGLAWSVSSPQGNLDVLVGPVVGISALAIAWLHHKVSIKKRREAPTSEWPGP
jgi:hypothetical protein